MNPTIKKKWVDALRSGDFKQTHRKLATMDVTAEEPRLCFCALGVLCELYRRERIEKDRHNAPEWTFMEFGWEESGWYFLHSSTALPDEVSEWAFGSPDVGSPHILVSSAARWNTGGDSQMCVAIMTLNDEDKMSFSKLADLIEQDEDL